MLSGSRVTLLLQAIFQGVGEKGGTEAHTVTAILEWVRLNVLQFFSLKKPEFDSTGFSCAALGLQPFRDPLPSTDVVRHAGNN